MSTSSKKNRRIAASIAASRRQKEEEEGKRQQQQQQARAAGGKGGQKKGTTAPVPEPVDKPQQQSLRAAAVASSWTGKLPTTLLFVLNLTLFYLIQTHFFLLLKI